MIRTPVVPSNTSPDLEFELQTPWALIAGFSAWLLALGAEIWSSEGMPRAWFVLSAAALILGFSAACRLASGIFPAALRRIAWAADGTWWLCDGTGREWAATLAEGSRRWGPVTILVWSRGARRWWAILTPVTVGVGPYRRLSARWRLRQHA